MSFSSGVLDYETLHYTLVDLGKGLRTAIRSLVDSKIRSQWATYATVLVVVWLDTSDCCTGLG